jgi:hypothetical protein
MDVQTISITLAGIGIFIAAINFIVSSRKADQQRQMELFMGIYDRFHADDFTQAQIDSVQLEWNDATDFYTKYFDAPIGWKQVWIQGKYYEGIGVLVSRGLFDLDLVEDLMGNTIIDYWEKFKPLFEYARRRLHPSHANQVEALYNAVVELKQKKYPAINA